MPKSSPVAPFVVAATLLVAMLLVAPLGTAAQDTPRLAGPVTDLVSAVSGEEGRIEEAIERLRAEADVQLFVLYTDTAAGFPVEEYASQVAADNGLGVADALYVVATDDRTHVLWLADDLGERVDVQRQDRVLLAAEDRLVDGDLAGASVVVAQELEESLTGGGLPLLPIILVLGLGAALVGGWYLLSRRRAEATVARRLDTLHREAAALLVQTDEQVRTASQEIGFVEAMYGPTEVGPYAAAIETARGELTAAFAIQQRLDDADPEDPSTREGMLREVVEHAQAAAAALAAQQARIRELRDMERDAPRLLAELEARLPALEDRLPRAERAREALEAYAPSDWEAVRGDRTEARKRIEAARESIAEARAVLAAGDTGQAALELREAAQALAEGTTLLDAIEGAARDLAAARERIEPELRDAAADLAAARDALAREPSAEGEARLAQATATLDEARRMAASTPLDVLGTLERADRAEAIADELVAGAREVEEARRREAAKLQTAIASAEAKVELARGYVSTHRHGVGSSARVRAAEAERHLEAAISLQASDPHAALAEARRAEQLADSARRDASIDFDTWDDRPPVVLGPGRTGGAGGGGGIDLGGVILGSILGGILSGGGSGPGWGGTSWGGPAGGGRNRSPSPRIPGSGGSRGGGLGGGFGGGRGRGGSFGGFGGFGGGGGGGRSGGGRARGGRW